MEAGPDLVVKVKVPRFEVKFTRRNVLILAGVVCGIGLLAGGFVFGWFWIKYGQIVNNRLKEPLFVHTAQIYAAPPEVRPGQTVTAKWVTNELQQAGYSAQGQTPVSSMGTYAAGTDSVTVSPGPDSYHAQDPATITFANGTVDQIVDRNGQQLSAYELEPLLVTGLSDQSRTKRRLVSYDELPKYMVPAVTSIEDRRFFRHGALDFDGILRSIVNDLKPGHHYLEGASTIDMQLAKMFFLTPQRTFKRKFLQVIVAMQMEHRFSKQQIFQMYANEVPMGEVGSYAIDGFGEAAQAYFGKDVGQLNLQQCALLAGMIQSPSWLNPFRHPHRALIRRNVVLDAMVEAGAISKEQAEQAKASPVDVVPGAFDSGEAPWFTELVRQQLQQRLDDPNYNEQGLRIYTSLDPDLQQVAQDAVNEGIKHTDEVVRARHERQVRYAKRHGIKPPPLVYPQVALVALNPHTGQVLALVGGRNYAQSQLDHVIAHRPTGSIFKPFVYAAAFNSSLAGTQLSVPSDVSASENASPGGANANVGSANAASTNNVSGIFTPLMVLHDEPTTFTFDNGQSYSPHDFNNEYYGDVPAVEALYRSLNNATIELAEMVGYDNVANLARAAGITSVQPTPAMAIGSYDATPLQMAGAYTVFANGGVKIDPWMLASVRAPNGNVIADYTPQTTPLLDPRVAFLTLGLMQQVLNNPHGTGAGIRSMGFTAPAAAKTGTSHDAWFAGFTSNLLCVVWVGNDDYSQLNIEGDRAAGPIWGDFMKAAVQLPQYSDTEQFVPPQGVVQVQLDDTTNLLADASCPNDWTGIFLAGTQPAQTCDHSIRVQQNIIQKIFGLGQQQPSNSPPKTAQQPNAAPTRPEQNQQGTKAPEQKKKPGFWARLFGRGNKDKQQDQQNSHQ